MDILFEDAAQLVCVKQPGLLSEDVPGKPCLPALLREHTASVFPVHRLDKETGGVMVFAKTKPEAARLSALIQQNGMQKEYLAILCGVPEEPAGTWEDLLFHDRARNKTYAVKRSRKGVKEARLSYRVLAEKDGLSLVQIHLHTGRTHQIRAQSASRHLPLLGDRRYGGAAADGLGLWAFSLTLPHAAFVSLPPAEGVWQLFADCLTEAPAPLI